MGEQAHELVQMPMAAAEAARTLNSAPPVPSAAHAAQGQL